MAVDAEGLIGHARSAALRTMCARSGRTYQGLAQAARECILDHKLRKKLVRLDAAYNIARQITEPSAQRLLEAVNASFVIPQARLPPGNCDSVRAQGVARDGGLAPSREAPSSVVAGRDVVMLLVCAASSAPRAWDLGRLQVSRAGRRRPRTRSARTRPTCHCTQTLLVK